MMMRKYPHPPPAPQLLSLVALGGAPWDEDYSDQQADDDVDADDDDDDGDDAGVEGGSGCSKFFNSGKNGSFSSRAQNRIPIAGGGGDDGDDHSDEEDHWFDTEILDMQL